MEKVLTQVLNPDLESREQRLAQEFQTAEPFRHVVIADFFEPQFCQRLLEDFPVFEDRYALNEIGEVGRKAAISDVRGISPVYRELDDFIQTPAFLDLVSEITGIPNLLYDPDYEGGGTHENLEGQGLFAHVDFNYHPHMGWHRRLNLIVYLNPEWEEDWGGNLELHSDPWDMHSDRFKSIPALLNNGVIFETSEHSWHGFSRIKLPDTHKHASRRSFAIYLYTEDRPPEEVAPHHATVYVPRSIPPGLQPGQVLSTELFEELVANFSHHREMLKFLYKRERDFTTQIEDLRKQVPLPRIEIEGAADAGPANGLFHDGWIGRELDFELTAKERLSRLILQVSIPEKLKSPQILAATAGDSHDRQEVKPGLEGNLHLPLNISGGDTVKISVHASTSFCPKDEGESPDTRQLAFKITSASVEA